MKNPFFVKSYLIYLVAMDTTFVIYSLVNGVRINIVVMPSMCPELHVETVLRCIGMHNSPPPYCRQKSGRRSSIPTQVSPTLWMTIQEPQEPAASSSSVSCTV